MSSVTKVPASSNHIISTEESGWTMYFDDFFNNHLPNNHNSSISLSSSSFLVSDAASLVDKKITNNSKQVEFSMDKNGKRSSFYKKRKDIVSSLIDDALEDTATSPLNSPNKVLYANQRIEKQKETEVVNLFSGQKDEQKELSFKGRDSDCTEELKKRGHSLVTLSMVANYDILCRKAQIKHGKA
ncbi:hypothetical protein VNO77_37116 [Canavalia gladiata]|uniref:Uncharacterized protein n=1 Tax=Canavalia gladiata TaxID=3824 RepID=A0AAN9PWY2_CANGL